MAPAVLSGPRELAKPQCTHLHAPLPTMLSAPDAPDAPDAPLQLLNLGLDPPPTPTFAFCLCCLSRAPAATEQAEAKLSLSQTGRIFSLGSQGSLADP